MNFVSSRQNFDFTPSSMFYHFQLRIEKTLGAVCFQIVSSLFELSSQNEERLSFCEVETLQQFSPQILYTRAFGVLVL